MLAPVMSEHQERRVKALWHAVGMNGIGKVFSVLCSLSQIPIALHYLGAEAFGVWSTLTGLTGLLFIADFGLGSNAQNRVAHFFGSGDLKAGYRVMNSTVLLLGGLGLAVVILGLPLCFELDWSRLFHGIPSTMAHRMPGYVFLVLAAFAIGLPLSGGPRFALALQHGWLTGLSHTLNSVLLLAATLLAVHANFGFGAFFFLTLMVPLLANVVVMGWLLTLHPGLLRAKPFLDLQSVRSFFAGGFRFFMISVGGAASSTLPSVILSSTLGPAAVVPYQLLQRLFSLFMQLQMLALAPLWSAYTEAYARGEFAWIRRTFLFFLKASFAFCALPILCGPVWVPWAINLWTGYSNPGILSGLNLSIFALFMAATAMSQVTATYLNGLGHLFSQSIFGTVSALLGLMLMPFLTLRFGFTGAIIALAAPFLLLNFPATSIETYYRLSNLGQPEARLRTLLVMLLPQRVRFFLMPKIVTLRLVFRLGLFILIDVLALSLVRRGRSGAVVVIQNAGLGDYLLFRNFLETLRTHPPFSGRKIVFCGNASIRELAEAYDGAFVDAFVWIDQKAFNHSFRGRFRVLKRLRQLGGETVVHAFSHRNLFDSDTLVRAVGGSERIGIEAHRHAIASSEKMGPADYNPRWIRAIGDSFYTRIIPDFSPTFEFDRYRAFFGQLLGKQPLPLRPEIIPLPTALPEIPVPCAILFPGAGQKRREWPIEQYAQLAAFLHRTHGFRVVVAGSVIDGYKAAAILLANPGIPIDDLTGQLSLPQLVALLDRSSLVVANDSGGVHLAAALGKKAVGISNGHLSFGSFHPYPRHLCRAVRFAYPPPMEDLDEPLDQLTIRFQAAPPTVISEVPFVAVTQAIAEVLGLPDGRP